MPSARARWRDRSRRAGAVRRKVRAASGQGKASGSAWRRRPPPCGRSPGAAGPPSSTRTRCCRGRSYADRAHKTETPSTAHVSPVARPPHCGRRGDVLKSGDQAQQRGLAATRRPHENHKGAVLDFQVGILDDVDGPERLADSLERYLAHGLSPFVVYLTAPKVSPRTSCRWVNHPSMMIGAMASVEAADSFAQNRPSGLE